VRYFVLLVSLLFSACALDTATLDVVGASGGTYVCSIDTTLTSLTLLDRAFAGEVDVKFEPAVLRDDGEDAWLAAPVEGTVVAAQGEAAPLSLSQHIDHAKRGEWHFRPLLTVQKCSLLGCAKAMTPKLAADGQPHAVVPLEEGSTSVTMTTVGYRHRAGETDFYHPGNLDLSAQMFAATISADISCAFETDLDKGCVETDWDPVTDRMIHDLGEAIDALALMSEDASGNRVYRVDGPELAVIQAEIEPLMPEGLRIDHLRITTAVYSPQEVKRSFASATLYFFDPTSSEASLKAVEVYQDFQRVDGVVDLEAYRLGLPATAEITGVPPSWCLD
jgi:hypothetical protein